jgi:hypothetical protein
MCGKTLSSPYTKAIPPAEKGVLLAVTADKSADERKIPLFTVDKAIPPGERACSLPLQRAKARMSVGVWGIPKGTPYPHGQGPRYFTYMYGKEYGTNP